MFLHIISFTTAVVIWWWWYHTIPLGRREHFTSEEGSTIIILWVLFVTLPCWHGYTTALYLLSKLNTGSLHVSNRGKHQYSHVAYFILHVVAKHARREIVH